MKGITPTAGEVLCRILAKQEVPEDTCVRFSMEGSEKGSLGLDEKKEGDHVFAHEENPVLLVGPDTFEKCRDKTLDFSDNEFQLC